MHPSMWSKVLRPMEFGGGAMNIRHLGATVAILAVLLAFAAFARMVPPMQVWMLACCTNR
jgi:hypothetical protein